jgi:hypothetical protein
MLAAQRFTAWTMAARRAYSDRSELPTPLARELISAASTNRRVARWRAFVDYKYSAAQLMGTN